MLFCYLFVKKNLIVIVNDLYSGSYYVVMKKNLIDIFCLIFVNEIIKLKFVDKLLNLNICVYDDWDIFFCMI